MSTSSSSLEILEDRIAPAAVTALYTPATGALEITGDDIDPHDIRLYATGANSYRVEGVATTVNGDNFLDIAGKITSLKFTGNDGDDSLQLFNLPALATFEFSGGDGDDSLTAYQFSVKGLAKFDFGAGGGEAYFLGQTAKFGGNLEIDMGAFGDFTSQAAKTTIAGTVTISGASSATDISYFELAGDVSTVGKGIIWNGGDGEEHLHLFSALGSTVGKNPTTGKAIAFDGGLDDDLIEGRGNLIKLGGTVDFTGGEGDNEIDFDTLNLQIVGDFLFTGGTGDDAITLGPGVVKVSGNANFLLGDGFNDVSTYGRISFGKDFKITGGIDGDGVNVAGTFLAVKGALEINLGDGDNLIRSVAETLQAGSLKITALAGLDQVSLGGFILKVGGATTIDLGEAANSFDADYDAFLSLAKTVTLTGGGDDDYWSFQSDKLTLGADLIATGGDGPNQFYLYGNTARLAGPFTYTGGSGIDQLFFEGSSLTVSKEVTVTAGDGLNGLVFSAAQTSLLKAVTFTGGADQDLLTFTGTKLTTAGTVTLEGNAGQDSFSVSAPFLSAKGNFVFNGGADEDFFSLIADGTLTGDVLVDLGAADAGTQDATLVSFSAFPSKLKIAGNLKLKAATTDTTAGGFTENVNIGNVSITKDVEILLGDTIADGTASLVGLENAQIGGNLTIRTGAGADRVNIDTFDSFGAMSIARITTINLGADDDQIAIGGSSAVGSNNLVRFLGNVTVDGGTGTNTDVNDIFNVSQNFFAPAAAKLLVNFP